MKTPDGCDATIMREQRSSTRFAITAPAYISAAGADDGGQTPAIYMTGNVSLGGAYLTGRDCYSVGTQLRVMLLLPSGSSSLTRYPVAQVRTQGVVIRAERDGMAVRFTEACRILPYRNMDAASRPKAPGALEDTQ